MEGLGEKRDVVSKVSPLREGVAPIEERKRGGCVVLALGGGRGWRLMSGLVETGYCALRSS